MSNNIFADWLEVFFDEVTPYEFYRDIFPAGELEKKRSKEENKDKPNTGKYTGIAIEVTNEKKPNGKPLIKRYSITDDLETIEKLTQSNNFCLCSPISYCGKQRTADNARFIYALAVDLDHIIVKDGKPAGLISLWNGHIVHEERIPKPTYIVSSGTGLHLYYVLDKPVALFQNTAKQLQTLKHELTDLIWGYGIVQIKDSKDIQQEGIYQGFRIPGTITKAGDRTRAFLTGDKVSIEYLNEHIPEALRVKKYTVKKELTKAKAKELYPEWYKRRVEDKQPAGVWHISRNLYDWWKREIVMKARVGHRYWCMMTLSVYAYKCSMYDPKHNPNPVTREELEKDCFKIMEYFETLTDDDTNHFNEADVIDALEAFDSRWIKYPRDTIEYRCGFELPTNNRKYRKQETHLKIARATKEIMKATGELKREGRPANDIEVMAWRAMNPNGIKADCIRDTGLSRPTVDKHWNTFDPNIEPDHGSRHTKS